VKYIDSGSERETPLPQRIGRIMILNTGMRTDIPAFYSEWFMNRIRAGYVLVRNP